MDKVFISKKYLQIISLFLFGMIYNSAYSQVSGCTDVMATNYSANATENDGSCQYPETTVEVNQSFDLAENLSENSGLIYWNGRIWTHNDNADTNLYALDPQNGNILETIALPNQTNTDWEEISQDEDFVYIGDFGNNANGNRTDLKILRISKPSLIANAPVVDIISFNYQDQTDFTPQGPNNTDYDCEAFVIIGDEILLFTKEWKSNNSRLYNLPKIPGNHQAVLKDTLNTEGLVTGATFKKEKSLIVLSGYSNMLQPFVYLLYDFNGDAVFNANKRKIDIDLPFHQVEGIATLDGETYYISNERFNPTGTLQKLHTLDLAGYLSNYLSVKPSEFSASIQIFPNPSKERLEIHLSFDGIKEYTITDISGKVVEKGKFKNKKSNLDTSKLHSGIYFLGIEGHETFKFIKK